MRKVYLVEALKGGKTCHATTYVKSEARKLAKANNGAVYSIPKSLYHEGSMYGWDAPTFKVQADVEFDFRKVA